MNDKLQEKYTHCVKAATGVTQPRLVMVLCRAEPKYVTDDSGSPAQDLDFPHAWTYSLSNPLLMDVYEYGFKHLLDLKCLN
jgi:hypothetical protein